MLSFETVSNARTESRAVLRCAVACLLIHAGCDPPSTSERFDILVDNPHDVPGRWYKANLHMHSAHSHGRLSAEPLVQVYHDAGYALLCITDHNMFGDQDGGIHPDHQVDAELHDWNGDGVVHETTVSGSGVEAYVRDWNRPRADWMTDRWFRPSGLGLDAAPLLLPGFEASYSYFGAHFGLVGYPPGAIDPPGPGFAWLDRLEGARGFSYLAHPGDVDDPVRLASVVPLERFHGMEVMNGARLTRGERADATALWDSLWALGYPLWGLANDDSHKLPGEDELYPFTAYNMVRVAIPTERSFLDALRAGAFYASTGLELAELRVERTTIRVRIPGARRIAFVGPAGVLHEQSGEVAAYTVQGAEGYARIEAEGDAVVRPRNTWLRKLWTQPLRVHRSPE